MFKYVLIYVYACVYVCVCYFNYVFAESMYECLCVCDPTYVYGCVYLIVAKCVGIIIFCLCVCMDMCIGEYCVWMGCVYMRVRLYVRFYYCELMTLVMWLW